MSQRIRLGVIVPSSNTVVEPVTQAIISSIQSSDLDVTVHFARVRVTKIDLSNDTDSQFSAEVMLTAAQLLADAGVDVISWSGTSAGWLGFSRDKRLCEMIKQATGIPATTSTLALNKLLHASGGKCLGLVSPYITSVNDAIRQNYAEIGFPIAEERARNLNMTENQAFAAVGESQLDEMVSHVSSQGADVVAVFCTNLRAAQRASLWESAHNILVLDSVAASVWGMLSAINIRPSVVLGWGAVFQNDCLYGSLPV